jgi:DHA2 family methylenomycin A resistance protein-like MFS transporter
MHSKKKQTIAFAALCMGFFMVILDVTIVNVTLPTLANYFATGITDMQWVVDGYTLMFAGFLLLIGTLTDHFGAKTLFKIGLITFSLTSLGCALSNSIYFLVSFRLLQGVSGALILTPSLALINTIYKDDKKRANAIGIWASIGGIACASGPFLGGLFTTFLTWRSIFAINIIIGIISFILVTKNIEETKPKHSKINFDFKGQLFGFVSIVALAFGLIEAGRLGWNSNIIIGCFSITIVSFILFIFNEKVTKEPMIPLSVFKNKMMSFSLIVSMILNLTFYGVLFTLPFYFHVAREYSVFITGLALLPLPSFAVIGSYLGGKSISKIGASRVMFFGLFIAAMGFFCLINIGETSPAYIWIMIPFFIIGFGVSFATPAMTYGAINSVESERFGMASSILNTCNQIGSVIGVAIFGTLISKTNIVPAVQNILLISGTLFLVASIIALVTTLEFKKQA